MEVQSIAATYAPWGNVSLESRSPSPDAPKPPKKRFLEEAGRSSSTSSQDENEEPLDLSGEFFIRASQQDLINRLVEKFCRNQEADDRRTSSRLGLDFTAQFRGKDLPLKKRNLPKSRNLNSSAQTECPANKYLDFVNKGICKQKKSKSRRS